MSKKAQMQHHQGHGESFPLHVDPMVGPTATVPSTGGFAPGDIVIRDKPAVLFPSLPSDDQLAVNQLRTSQLAIQHGLPFDFFHALEVCDDSLAPKELSTLVEALHSPLALFPDLDSPVPLSINYSRVEVGAVTELFRANAEMKYLKNQYWGNDFLSECEKLQRDHDERERKSKAAAASSKKGRSRRESGSVHNNGGSSDGVDSIPLKVRRLCSFLHGIRVNTHSDEISKTGAVFGTACKFSHSCSPNTFWHFERNTDGTIAAAVHIASRKIAPGEMVSFSYIGTGLNLMQPTSQRRHLLSVLNFVCGCERCRVFDAGNETCRRFPCPQCAAKKKIPTGEEELFSVALMPRQHGGWYCTNGKHIALNVEESLLFERQTFGTVMTWFFSPGAAGKGSLRSNALEQASISKSKNELERRWLLLEAVHKAWGRQSYLTAIAASGMFRCIIQASAVKLTERENDLSVFLGIQQHEKEDSLSGWLKVLLKLIQLTMKWFEGDMNLSPQHLKVCVTIAEMTVVVCSTVADMILRGGGGEGSHKDRQSIELSLAVMKRFRNAVVIPLIKPFGGMQEFLPVALPSWEPVFAPLD